MARTNKLKLVASLIEAEIISAKIELAKEVTSCNYGKASGWQERIAGLEQALSYIRVQERVAGLEQSLSYIRVVDSEPPHS